MKSSKLIEGIEKVTGKKVILESEEKLLNMKTIGKTKSGKPIILTPKKDAYKDFTGAEFEEALNILKDYMLKNNLNEFGNELHSLSVFFINQQKNKTDYQKKMSEKYRGKQIGKTSSGKPVYDWAKKGYLKSLGGKHGWTAGLNNIEYDNNKLYIPYDYQNFTKQDHKDAIEIHKKNEEKLQKVVDEFNQKLKNNDLKQSDVKKLKQERYDLKEIMYQSKNQIEEHRRHI